MSAGAGARAVGRSTWADEGVPPLPVPVTPPLGRDDELARIARWFGDGARLITLTGQPGVGKTRLALHVAQEVRGQNGWSAIFLPLDALSSADQIPGAIAQALSIGEDELPLIDRIKRRLGVLGPALLLMDNLEHLAGAKEVVASIVEACPDLRLLLTSRSTLQLPQERKFAVQPLPVPDRDASLSDLRANSAVQLFAITASRGNHKVLETDLAAVGRICASMDGLPLAIELASARLAELGIAGLEHQLQERRTLISLKADFLEPRHESLESAIKWSYDLLPVDAQRGLNRLAVFRGGFNFESAQHLIESPSYATYVERASDLVSDSLYLEEVEQFTSDISLPRLGTTTQAVLQTLLEANLIQATTGVNDVIRYGMLESIRSFALEQLEASGEAAQANLVHAISVFWFVEGAGHELWTERNRAHFWPHVSEEAGNTRAALAWACDPINNQPSLATLLVLAAWFSFQVGGLSTEARDWLERALALPDASERTRLHAMNSLAYTAWSQGDGNRASELTQTVIESWKPGYPLGTLGVGHFVAGLVAWLRGDFQGMAEQVLIAKPILQEADDPNGVGFCNLALGVLARFTGQFDQARALLDEAFTLHSEHGHAWGAATSRYLAGEAVRESGDIPGATGLLIDGLRRYWEQRDVYGSGACIAALAVLAADRHEHQRSARLFGSAFAMCEHAGVILPPVDAERYKAVAADVATRVSAEEFAIGRAWSPVRAVAEAEALAIEIMAGRVPGPSDDPLVALLTPDQLDAVNLLCEGLDVKQIADCLFRDRNAIYDRLARARERLGASSNRHLVALVIAIRAGERLTPDKSVST